MVVVETITKKKKVEIIENCDKFHCLQYFKKKHPLESDVGPIRADGSSSVN